MWIGEQITEHGVGNGISIVLMINILSRVPHDLAISVRVSSFNRNDDSPKVLCAACYYSGCYYCNGCTGYLTEAMATRRIPVQYAKKMQGRKMVGGQSTFIPLKVNTAGVIPVIFASSLL